jgi:uncharacterized protein (DUF305 family)
MTRKTLVGTALAVLTAGAVLAGCSNSGHDMSGMGASSSSSSAAVQQGDHNQADVAFVQQMIPHHQQAVDMAGLVPGHTTNPQVADLAGRIQKAQDPEIARMSHWLTSWGAPAPTSMPGMDHGSADHGTSMPGMMSPAEMTQLQQAEDAEFDRLWLGMMIKHHQGAIDMAETELAAGSNADAKKLAQQIVDAQQAEIDEMHALLPQG